MNEPILSEFSKGFSETLLDFCAAPGPDIAFVPGLEQQLLNQHAKLRQMQLEERAFRQNLKEKASGLFSRRAWGYAIVLLLAALILGLLAIGPQSVLAQVQRWLNYAPGIGFVNLAETQVLVSPVEATREGVTLRVEQVIAGPDQTEVMISSSGFSEEDLPWPNEAVDHPDFTAFLLLPDGSRMEMTRWELSVGAGKLEFPALPDGVQQATLLVPRLPLVPPGVLPQDWEIPLNFRPADGEIDDALFPQPYNPPDALDIHHGITLRVLDVAQTSSETALRYQVEWTDPDWEFWHGLGAWSMPELRDDVGHIYWESLENSSSSVAVVAIPAPDGSQATPAPVVTSYSDTLVFSPLSLSAGQATLWVDALEFQVPASAVFTIDLGNHPQIGDSWSLDIRLEVAGIPVHFTGARLRQEMNDLPDGTSETSTFLEFDLDPLSEKEEMQLSGFDLSSPDKAFNGSGSQGIGSNFKPYLSLDQAKEIPSGVVPVQVSNADLAVFGPWVVTWDLPHATPVNSLPVRIHDLEAFQGRHGIGVGIQEVFLSDRLTALSLDATGLPPDATFVQALSFGEATFDPSTYKTHRTGLNLEDNWGRHYEPGKNEAFIRPEGDETGYDPRWKFFPPLEPLAQSLTLHIPGIEVFVPGQASFEIEVPQDLTFKQEEVEVTVVGGGGPERQETETQWVTDSWPVDILLEIAGYRMHFSQAQIEQDVDSNTAYLLSILGELPEREQDRFYLNSLRFAKVEQPDGQRLLIDPAPQNSGLISSPFGGVGLSEPGSDQYQVGISLDVTAADRYDLLPGRYHVALNGVTVWIPGPWDVNFSLSSR